MHPYRIALVAFVVPVVIFIGILAKVCTSDRMPAPRISPSYSFNEKALWLRKALRRDSQADILIVGSSMGVNNISGSELAQITGTEKIINAGSWGLSLPVTWSLTRELLNRIHPQVVILMVYYGDFQQVNEVPDWDSFNELLSEWSEIPSYLENPEGNYYREHYGDQSSASSRSRQSYDSLAFDAYGGVPLNPDHFQYNSGRWDLYKKADLSYGPSEESLAALKEMATALQKKKIGFMVVVSPMRQVVEEKSSSAIQSLFWDKIRPVVEESKGQFVHIHGDASFDDSFFVDSYHMNANGAKKTTKLLAPTLRTIFSKK